MKKSFDTKVKDRSPEETITIITDFFKTKKLKLEYYSCYREESLTWFVRVYLFYKNEIIATSNGKGMSENFAIASGLGEMYERYCNKIMLLGNSFIANKVCQRHYEKYGYFLHPKEKEISADYLFQYFEDIIQYYGDMDFIKNYFNLRYAPLIGVPYNNFLNNTDTIYLDNRILPIFNSSSGMAGGNSYKEAFNQGFSEILEHYWAGIFLNNSFEEYYQIDLSQITNIELLNSIKNIQLNNNDLYIYDISYNIHFPVLMGVLVCKDTNKIFINISASPIFDIALERIITEIYQGGDKINQLNTQVKQLPYKNYSIEYLYGTSPGSVTTIQGFPEDIFFKSKIVNNYSNCFLNNLYYNNDDIYEYYKQLIINHNLQVYISDVSQCEDMCAISIFVKNLSSLSFLKSVKLAKNKSKCQLFLLNYYKFFNNLINNKNYDFNLLYQLANDWLEFSGAEQNFIGTLIYTDHFSQYKKPGQNGLTISYLLYHMNDIQIQQQIISCAREFNYYDISKYILLYSYKQQNKYSTQEIKNIMQNIYKINFTEEDYNNILNPNYLIKKIFLDKIYNIYHENNEYIEILSEY